MSVREVTPGYVWSEEPLMASGVERHDIDLRTLYPIPSDEALHSAWDSRRNSIGVSASGVLLKQTVFNPDAEGDAIFWLPGWNVSGERGGGARVVATLAALNPDKVVITAEEPLSIPIKQRDAAVAGNMKPYADNYMKAIEPYQDRITALAGHSRGGLIQANLAARSDMEQVRVLNLMDVPGAQQYNSWLRFAVRAGLLDNLTQRKKEYQAAIAQPDEQKLAAAIADAGENGGPLEALTAAKEQLWLIRAMARTGLQPLLESALITNPDLALYAWHGRQNVGAPVAATRKMLEAVAANNAGRVHYFESPTGHFSEGHTARYARQTTYAIDQTS